jgi:hypothetical protein
MAVFDVDKYVDFSSATSCCYSSKFIEVKKMKINKTFVISNAQEEIKELEKRAKYYGDQINKRKPKVQAGDQKEIKELANEYIRLYPQNTLSVDRDRADTLISIYKQKKTRLEYEAEKTKILVQQLENDDKTLLQDLKELNDKLNVCCGGNYEIEICQRLKDLIEKFLLTSEDSCQKHLSQCKALFGDN